MTETLGRRTFGWSKPVSRLPGQTSEHWWSPKSLKTACGRYTRKKFVPSDEPKPGLGNHPCGRCFNAWKRWSRRENLGA